MMGQTNWMKNSWKLAVIGASSAMLAACNMTPEQDRAAIESEILATPGSADLWQTIKDEYPEDFDVLVGQIQALDMSERLDPSKGEEIGKVWLQQFFERIGPDSVKAPAAELLVWSATEHELYATLQRSAVTECAAMTMGQWIFVDDGNAPVTAAIARRNAAMVRASAAGRNDPQDYAEPGEAAFNRLGESIAGTGIDPELQSTLGSDEAMAALTPAEQCEIGVAVYAGLSALPDDEEPEMAAYMLAPA